MRNRLTAAIAAAVMIVGGLFVSAAPASASVAVPVSHVVYAEGGPVQSLLHQDSYGLWIDPMQETGIDANGFKTKLPGTGNTHVYASNMYAFFANFYYVRVWYMHPNGTGLNSHNPVLVLFSNDSGSTSNTKYDLGPVPDGDRFRVEVLTQSSTPGVMSAKCYPQPITDPNRPCAGVEHG